jgi:two-component system sensor histidine kinase MprB
VRTRGWWQRRDLHTRLSLLVTGAVAAAVVLIAVVAWLAVAEIQHRQISDQLTADAEAISAEPDQWLATSPALPAPGGRRHESFGPRWQVLAGDGTIRGSQGEALPVTAAARVVAAGHHRPVQEEITIGDDTYLMVTRDVPGGGGAVQVAINLERSEATLALLGVLLAAGCLVGIGGAALLGRAVARTGLAPVGRLTDAVEEVAATTDLSRRLDVDGNDEIARLGRSVNTLLAAIDDSRRAQRALVEDAGHELRTPLTSIRTNIELLREVERHPELAHRLSADDRAGLLTDLDSQVAELATLTIELVELAREDSSREQTERVDLADVVAAAVARVRMRAPGRTFASELTPVRVSGRPGELERMVVNLLDNAAKWSPPDGVITTRLTPGGAGWCRLTVADTGPGIADDDRPHVFDRFYRAAAARALPGSGLGLAIVAQTAAQHGGTATAAPNKPHGTVITIRLPAID